MRIGILGDSHDHLAHLERAVRLLREREVEAWIHLGDYVAPFAARPLLELPDERLLLWGNNDGERPGLLAVLGEIVPGPTIRIMGGRTICAMHEPYALEAAVESGLYDVVLYGHTHRFELRRVGGTLILNPGEVCGWLTQTPTCAILDTEGLRAEILTVYGEAVELEET